VRNSAGSRCGSCRGRRRWPQRLVLADRIGGRTSSRPGQSLGEDVEGVGTLTGWTSLREGAEWGHSSAPRDGEVRQEHEGKQRLSSRGVSGKNPSSCSIGRTPCPSGPAKSGPKSGGEGGTTVAGVDQGDAFGGVLLGSQRGRLTGSSGPSKGVKLTHRRRVTARKARGCARIGTECANSVSKCN
jgi:hypothetical protein